MTLSGASALSLQTRDTPAVISFPLQRRSNSNQFQKPGDTIALPAGFRGNVTAPIFVCIVALGTPPQPVEVVLDTSHSLLVVASSNSELCASTPLGCVPPGSSNATSLGSFSASASSTYKSTGEQFNITALELGNLSGDLVQDQLTLGTATVGMTFGLENLSADYLLGIGYSLNNTYTSLPQALLESRQINSAAYSLWMEGQNGTNNEISFALRNPQPGPDNILEIGNGSGSAIPGAVSVSPATTVTAAVPTIFQQPSGVWPLTTSTSAQTISSSTPTGKSAASFSSSRNKNGLLVVLFNTCFWLVL